MTAVAPVVIRGNGLWVGWPGIQLTSEEEPIPESDPSDQTPTAGLKSSQVSLEFSKLISTFPKTNNPYLSRSYQ